MARPKGTCSVTGCERPIKARGWCFPHYRRWRRWGDPRSVPPARPARPPADRFRDYYIVDITSGCWIWQGGAGARGYGRFHPHDGHTMLAHRFAYELLVGPIPEGLTLDHLCRNPPCVNPAHLEPVTMDENRRRAWTARTECKWGHPYTPENTYLTPAGHRTCRTCTREGERRRAPERNMRRRTHRSA